MQGILHNLLCLKWTTRFSPVQTLHFDAVFATELFIAKNQAPLLFLDVKKSKVQRRDESAADFQQQKIYSIFAGNFAAAN